MVWLIVVVGSVIQILNLRIAVDDLIIFLVVLAGCLILVFLLLTFHLIKSRGLMKERENIRLANRDMQWNQQIEDFESAILQAQLHYSNQRVSNGKRD